MGVSTAVLLALAWFQSVDVIESPQEVIALTDCSQLEEPTNCFSLTIFSGWSGTRRRTRFEQRQFELSSGQTEPFYSTVAVSGRLNGGEIETFNVTFGMWDDPCTHDGWVILTGMTETGHPIIATEQGFLELTEPNLYTGVDRAVLIDAATRSVISYIYGDLFWFSPFFYHGPDDVTAFLPLEQRCVTAPMLGQPVRGAQGRCNIPMNARHGELPHPYERGLEEPQDTDLDLIEEVMGADWVSRTSEWSEGSVFRMQGHDIIVVEDRTVCT